MLPYVSKGHPGGGARQVLIVGSGAFGQGLASLAHRSGATAAYDVSMGSRKMQPGSVGALPGLEQTPVRSLDEALPQADMVILAVPASGLSSFVSAYGSKLAGKVVVDVTNAMKSDYARLAASAPSTDDGLDVEGKDLVNDQCVKYGKAGAREFAGPTTSTANWLSSVLPSSALVVKAFSNLSAYTLIHGDTLTEHVKSVAASNDSSAAETVAEFGRALGLEMRVVPSLNYASTLEGRQHSLLPVWQWPATLMFVTWVILHIYSFIRYQYYGKSPWYQITLWITNKSIAWVSLWGMVYTYLPGVLVCYWQLIARRPAVRLPGWFKSWMDARKQLGLLSMFTMLLHLLFSTFLWMPSYYSKLWDKTDATVVPTLAGSKLDAFGMMKAATVPVGLQVLFNDSDLTYASSNATVLSTWPAGGGNFAKNAPLNDSHPLEMLTTVTNVITLRSRLNWIGESSTLLGIISGILMGVIALTSVPCITPKMNWREWRLLQSQTGWISLVTATVHVILLGAPWWPAYRTDWPGMLPTITLLSTIPPMLVLLLKGLLVLPPVSIMLNRVRSGKWARKDDAADPLANTAVYAVKHD